jgi:predicted nucleic acid-binding protein
VIVCDTGPIVSAMNRSEGRRHRFAAELLARLGRDLIVPWPVFVEADLLLRARGHVDAALILGRALLGGTHRLVAPTEAETATALDLGERYSDTTVDIVDLSVMAFAASRDCGVLTWDFRHFRSVVLDRGHHWSLLVQERDLPGV